MNNIKFLYIFIGIFLLLAQGCEEPLDEKVYSQIDPNVLLNSADGVKTVLFAGYAVANIVGHDGKSIMNLEDWSTDIEWETGGGENRTAVLMINFTWDASVGWINGRMWSRTYRAIRNANIVLENLGSDLSEADQDLFRAEARFIRALSYYRLYTWFGPVPIRQSTQDDLNLPRATEDEMKTFLEQEFTEIISDLPNPGSEENYGRAHKAAAIGYLTKFYLNTKQWQKCADAAKQLMDMNYYELFPDYYTMFRVENEMNREFIWVNQGTTQGGGSEYINGAFPINYKSLVDGSAPHGSNMANWAAQYRIYDSFYNSFEPGDKRRDLIISEYINKAGNTVSLLNANNTRSFKYWPDVDAVGNDHGNDNPELRYADILLARAEALNEINGPNQQSIDLINQVRTRAGLANLAVSDFASKDELRSHILDERGWEFYNERKRRQDLIRHGKYISSAQARGVTAAKDYHVRFAIPQTEIDANPLCVQNEGYGN